MMKSGSGGRANVRVLAPAGSCVDTLGGQQDALNRLLCAQTERAARVSRWLRPPRRGDRQHRAGTRRVRAQLGVAEKPRTVHCDLQIGRGWVVEVSGAEPNPSRLSPLERVSF